MEYYQTIFTLEIMATIMLVYIFIKYIKKAIMSMLVMSIVLSSSCTVAKRLTKPPYPGIATLAVGFVIVKSIPFKKQ